VTYEKLSARKHRFRVRATSADGTVESTPASYRWRVRLRPFPNRTLIHGTWHRFTNPREFVLFNSLEVRRVPKGAKITVRCRGACGQRIDRRWRAPRSMSSLSLMSAVRGLALPPGSAVDVRVRKRGYQGIGKLYCVRRGDRTRKLPYLLGGPRVTCRSGRRP
jgi:hypothetical protein